MSQRPWSPAEAEQHLAEVIHELDGTVTDLQAVTRTAAEAKYEFEIAEAKQFTRVRSTGVAQEEAKRRALSDPEVSKLYKAHLLAEAVARSQYKAVDVRKTQADGLRSLLVSARGVSS